ncbi:MAG: hypothetical protein FWD19_02885 [Defluviitaleaceae bacterium]|nr:hypothetical protein [Defluviitaleaceae bacterium]
MKKYIFLLLAAGFFARLFAFAQIDFAFGSDVGLFQAWAMRIFDGGFANFYSFEPEKITTDYPPVYMYILWLIGAIRAFAQNFFGAEWEFFHNKTFRFFTFLPAMTADLGIGFVLYKMALGRVSDCEEHSQKETLRRGIFFALLVAAAWIFNPAIILISSVWGQIESIFVLMLLVSLNFLRAKKLLPAYILFGLAIFTKPQSLFLGPVYLYSAFDFLRENFYAKNLNAKKILHITGNIFAGIFVMVLVSLPFGLGATYKTVLTGMGMHAYSSVNAFNFWAILGMWRELDEKLFGITYTVWGIFIALVIIFGALFVLHFDRTRRDGKNFFLIVGVLFVVIFAFSIRMHERYLFPALLFFLAYWLENKNRRELILYCSLSAVFFLNCLEVLRWVNIDKYDIFKSSVSVVSYVTVFLAIAAICLLVRNIFFNAREKNETIPDSLKNPPPMRTRDYVHIAILIVAYGALAFYNLGDKNSPQSTWIADENPVIVDFGEVANISQIQFLMGARENIPFNLYS